MDARKRGQIWHLEMLSWVGHDPRATHAIPILYSADGRKVNVAWCLSADEARQMNADNNCDDGWMYVEGQRQTHFPSPEEAIRASIIVWERIANKERDLLLHGYRGDVLPRKPLAGPEGLMPAVVRIAERLKGWNMGDAEDEWYEICHEHIDLNPDQVMGSEDRYVESEEVAWGKEANSITAS